MTTIKEVLEKGATFLSNKGVESARLNMELLVAHVLELQRMDLYLRFDQALDETQLTTLRSQLTKRGQRVPLQHLTGISHFGNYQFKTDARALIPRPETEELVSLIHTQSFHKPARILDLACGSGVLGLTLAKDLGPDCSQLTLSDLSAEALSLAQENAQKLEVEADFIESDLFENLTGPFDLIVANLPYIAEGERSQLSPEVLHDPAMALFSGHDGLDLLRRFCASCSEYLSAGGLLALEVGHQQGTAVTELLREAGLADVTLHQDLNGISRFPLARQN